MVQLIDSGCFCSTQNKQVSFGFLKIDVPPMASVLTLCLAFRSNLPVYSGAGTPAADPSISHKQVQAESTASKVAHRIC